VAALLALAGCDEDRPYTPFQVASSLPPRAGDAPPPPPATAAQEPAIPGALVLVASGLPSSWAAFGRTLQAPPGTGFAAGVELPTTAGQPSRVFAWVVPRRPGHFDEGGLFAIDERGKTGRVLARFPDFLPSGADCAVSVGSLAATALGIFTTLQTKCKGHLLPGTATGAFLVTSPAEQKSAPFLLRLVDGGLSEPLKIDVGGSAAPNGTISELVLQIDLTAPSGAHARLPLRFVGKAGGLSRVADAPSSDLETLAKELAALVPRKKEREAALGRIDAARRWVLSVCKEGGAARVLDETGRPFACGSVKPSLDRLTEAAIEAYLYRDEHWKAVGEYERADYYLSPPPAAAKERWAARLAEKGAVVKAEVAREFPLRLGLDVPYPFASPLRYGQDGRLYGLTADGDVSELGVPKANETAPEPPAPLDQPAADRTPKPWPLRPRADDGRLLSGLVPSCDRPEAQLAFVAEGGAPAPSVALPFLSPRPCRGLLGKPLPIEPIAWQGPALLAMGAGEPILSQGSLMPPAEAIAWGSSLGVEVWSRDGYASWRGAGLHDLHHCVVGPRAANGKPSRVACVRGRAAVEVVPAEAPPPATK